MHAVTITEVVDTLAGSCEHEYVVTRTFTAATTVAIRWTHTQTITIVDTTEPALEEGQDLVVECDGNGNLDEYQAWLANHGGATATDGCGVPMWSHVAGEFDGACASTGSVEVVFTATDACGNSTSYTGTFTIQDTTAPSFDGDLQLEFGCNDFDMAESYINVEDACGDVDLTWEDIELSGGCVKPVGRYLRLYTATDARQRGPIRTECVACGQRGADLDRPRGLHRGMRRGHCL